MTCKIVRNYMVSILPKFRKLFEMVIYKQVYRFTEKFSVLFDHQFGFRSGKSASQAILHSANYVYPCLDLKSSVLSVFYDFSKVFDSVDHSIFLRKLYHIGIREF